jgi:hypothetical protein
MKYKLLTIATTIGLFFTLTGYSQNFWEVLNTPVGYGVNSLAINSDEDIFVGFATSSGGGVFHKLNNGNSWDTSLFFSNNLIGEIYIDKSDNIFAATSDAYYSDDNGDNWSLIFPSHIMGVNSIYRSSFNSTFIGIWGGIYKSDSVNSNWMQVLSFGNYEVVNAIIEDTINGILYAGTTNYLSGGGVYRSVDGGDTWENIGLINHYVSSLALNSSGDLFAGVRGGNSCPPPSGMFKLPHDQAEWINVKDQELVTSMVINSKDEIYIGCSNLDLYIGGVRRSMDNGQTWEMINTGMGNQNIGELVLDSEGYLYVVANSSTPLFKSINSTEALTLDGSITYANANATPLSNTHVQLMQEDFLIRDTITDAEGYFFFTNINSGTYTMLSSTTKPWGGVTASDILLYRKHIANISSLNGFYLASGDVNGSGDLTAVDVLLIKKRIANIITTFPTGDWLFNNQPVMVNGTNVTYNFNGICYGDANGSHVPQ